MGNTLSEVFEEVYDLMWEKTTSTTYPITSAVSLINRYIAKVCRWQVVSLLDKRERFRWGNLKFLEKNVYYSNISSQVISVETVVWWDTLTISTTYYPNSGAILINGEIVTYTNKSATQLTGVVWITAKHPVWSRCILVFALPENISKPFQVFDTKGKEIEFQDFRYNDKTVFFSILTQDWVDYLYLNNCNQNNFLVKYYLKPTSLVYNTDNDTEIILPDDYWIDMIAPMVAWDMKYNKWEEMDIAQNNLVKWYATLQEFFDFYSTKAVTYRKWVNVTQPWDPTLAWRRAFYNDDKDFRNV